MPKPLRPENSGEPLLTPPRVEDVFAATEAIRASEFQKVPAHLLQSVLAAERDNPEDRASAARAVGRAIDAYLADTAKAHAATADQEGTV